jgi:drug/metabolite transporter (DMT)-like permease
MEGKKSDYGTSTKNSSLQIEAPSSSSPTVSTSGPNITPPSQFWVYSNFISCLIVGPLNFVSYKVMYAAYGESRAFFVSQGVNFLYVLYGGIILHYLTKKGEITEEMKAIPHLKFIVMGFLDCLGGFLAAMGANRTPGSLQQLLNQTLIPIIMFMSWLFLGKTSTYLQLIGATVILFGACVVILPSSSNDESGSETFTSSYDIISYLLYFSSNIPIAFSCIYKEMGFRNLQVHVMYMTQLVSIYQLLWGFVLGVLQMMPGVGSETGYSLSEINSSFWSGVLCFLEMDQV